jgi:hypothetical protein
MRAWLHDEFPFPKSRVNFFYHLHGPSKYNLHNVITCITNDDFNNIDVIKVQSTGVCVILNLISYIVEHSSDDCFIRLYRRVVNRRLLWTYYQYYAFQCGYDDDARFALSQHTQTDCIVLVRRSNCRFVDVSLHSDTLSWFRAN